MVFNDLIGRKTLMVWVTNQKITARDLVKNEHYDYNKINPFSYHGIYKSH